MTAFPWTVLITGISTLGASLGAVWLKSRYDYKTQKEQAGEATTAARSDRQREAYADLLKTARLYLRATRDLVDANVAEEFDESGEYTSSAARAANKRLESLTEELNEAVAKVELLGSDEARSGAKDVYNKIRAIHTELVADIFDSGLAKARMEELATAMEAFVDTVRPEITLLARLSTKAVKTRSATK